MTFKKYTILTRQLFRVGFFVYSIYIALWSGVMIELL